MYHQIPDPDLKVETMRSRGAGGQNVNKVESAVRLTHLPTGVTVRCDEQRSQHQNRSRALARLKTKLFLLAKEFKAKQLRELHKDQVQASWGNQVRSYVLHPQKMVKDLRTGVQTRQATEVLEGEIDMFIKAYLEHRVSESCTCLLYTSPSPRDS
eukprot:TRINITY_DN49982_c0_g1_i1.p1 TRINITY_DN49982_c0_g1~~TRINITY_DN49982_c0_g1_i1.p1  ORF type:complete len:155 (-),score=31.69 TRINITY_DN49982_c0_g1_i1:78-542(-)